MNMNILNKSKDDLWNSILQAAMQGKLSEQLDTDTSVEVTLEEIRKERESQEDVSGRKGKKNSSKKDIQQNSNFVDKEVPFDIPKNWKWVTFGNIAEIKSSKRVFEKDYVQFGIPFFRSKEIGNLYNKNKINTELFISEEHYNSLKENYGVPKIGDILLTSVGTIGNTWICDDRKFYYKDGNITQICKNSGFLSEYIDLFLHSSLFNEQVFSSVTGTAYSALTIVKLKSLILPLPPIEEQARIVNTLNNLRLQIDKVYNKQEELTKSKQALKESLLQSAMNGELTQQNDNFVGFKDWNKKNIFELCTMKQWKTIPSDELLSSGYPVYGANGIIGFTDKYNHTETTLLLTCRGATCGSINLTNGKCYVNGNALAFENLNEIIDIYFLKYYLQSLDMVKMKFITGTAQPQITQKNLQSLNIIFPDIITQKYIVKQLDNLFSMI